MEDSSFTVTLPSNSNIRSHPDNRGHNYVVKLASPINLTKNTLNDDSRWEVALTTLQYTNSFYQVREDILIYAVVIVPNLESIHMRASFGYTKQFDADVDKRKSAIAALSQAEQRIFNPFYKDADNATETWFVVLGRFVLPAGEYRSPLELARRLAKQFNAVFNIPRYQYRMQVEMIGPSGALHLSAESKLGTYQFFLYSENVLLSSLLGSVMVKIDDLEPVICYITPISNFTPTFNTVHSLYVYCDICENQLVGNQTAPLMDIAPVQGVPGQRSHFVFDPPTYLPVSRNFIETIRIVIHDGTGGHIVFPDDVGNVVCRLHFRHAARI